MKVRIFLALVIASLAASPATRAATAFELRDGDRIALVGSTFIEREAMDGYIETALLLSHPELNLTFRNFGWSGDTAKGESRGYFKPEDGYGSLLHYVVETKPTVIVLNYGANASWQGQAGLESFEKDLNKLMDDLAAQSQARFVLVSPLAQETFPAPYPNADAHNRDLELYSNAIKQIADKRQAAFVDLFTTVRAPAGTFITSNSVHLTPEGYRQAAAVMVKATGKAMPDLSKAEPLRAAVIAKNGQFFNYWRPQNTTYLVGFRKHEQGRNAVEMQEILPYVDKFDTQIRELTQAAAKGQTIEVQPIVRKGVGFNPSEGKYIGTPEKDLATFQLAEDLEVSVFAAEPMVVNPTNMNWDAQGRLWVSCAPLYPHVKPGHGATDRVVVLEDTDHDGKADKSTVFAENLLIPTAVLPGNGGVYVANSTELLFLKDTDGDGKADSRTVVLSGFGTEDTHHILHTPRWGQDGLMYLNQSIYIHSHVETPWGVSRLMAGGIWQFEPLTGRMDVVGRGLVNSWGHQMDEYGQSFATDGAGGDGINYVFPGVAGVTAYGTNHIMRGMNPGQPKHCSLEIISGTQFPEKYRGLLIANDFRGHRTNSFRITEKGSGYQSTQDVDIIATAEKGADRLGAGGAFRPIDVKMGPDGGLYVADWSNIIIQHGEVDFRDDRRDHEHGRIWRITGKGRPALQPPPIAGAPIDQLLKNLSSSERWVVDMSKRELIERGPSVLPQVEAWGKGIAGDNADALRLHALWLHVGLDTPNPGLLAQSLSSTDGRVRAAAIRVLRHWLPRTPDAMAILDKAVADPHSRVRLEALHALRDVNTQQAAESAIRVLDSEMDDVLNYALIFTIRELRPQWEGKSSFSGNPKYFAFAVQATGSPAALAPLVAAFEQGTIPAAAQAEVLSLIGRLGDGNQMGALLGLAAGSKLPTNLRVLVLNAVGDGVVSRKVRPAGDLKVLVPLLADADDQLVAAAAKLAGQLHVGEALGELQRLALAADGKHSQTAVAAIGGIGGKGAGGASGILENIVGKSNSTAVKLAAIAELVNIDCPAAAKLAVATFATLDAAANPTPVFDAFYRQKDGPQLLQQALTGNTIPEAVARVGVRQATTCGRPLDEHVRILSTAGGLKPMQQQLSEDEMKALVARVNKEGNPAAGERIYHRQSLACISCHAIGGAGSPVGPDLISIGASAPVDYLIESLLNPSAKIKEGYHMTVISLKNGQSFAGAVLSDSPAGVVLRDPVGKSHTIAQGDIAGKVVNPTSMMPAGLTASLQPEEFIHLVSFLSQLGKAPAYRSPNARVLRAFTAVMPDDGLRQAVAKKTFQYAAENAAKLQWHPAVSYVNGDIPLDDPAIFQGGLQFLRFTVETAADGKIGINYTVDAPVSTWIDGQHQEAKRGAVEFDLKKGQHDVIVCIKGGSAAPLRVELSEVKGSAAAAKLVMP